MTKVYIVSATRTPIGRFGGAFANLSPADLGAAAMKGALEKAGITGDALDLLVFGNVLRGGHGQLIPRQAGMKAGIPLDVDSMAVDMVCASGMAAVYNGVNAIRAGDAELVLAGGIESMSQAGFVLSSGARWGYKLILNRTEPVYDMLQGDGLTDPTTGEAMGSQADRLAAEYGVSRDDVDAIAAMSQQRAEKSTAAGLFAAEITPVTVKTRKGETTVTADEGIRPGTTVEALARLRPAFGAEGIFTAGNSSQISDGAAALVIAGESAIKKYNLTPLAEVLGSSWYAGETWRFPEAPIPATKKLLDKLGMGIADFDFFETNEAFALNNVLYHRLLEIPHERINPLGGAIAIGHPIGASGARILVTLLNVLTQNNAKRGLASICHGMGGAAAMALERV